MFKKGYRPTKLQVITYYTIICTILDDIVICALPPLGAFFKLENSQVLKCYFTSAQGAYYVRYSTS